MLQKIKKIEAQIPVLCLCKSYKEMPAAGFDKEEQNFIQKQFEIDTKTFFPFFHTNGKASDGSINAEVCSPRRTANKSTHSVRFSQSTPYLLQLLPQEDPKASSAENLEKIRLSAEALLTYLADNKLSECIILDQWDNKENSFAYVEALVLGAYRFDKYKKDLKYKGLQNLKILSATLQNKEIENLEIIREMVWQTKDWVNEPVSGLNALQLAERARKLGNESGVKVDVWNKEKIRKHAMGGILGVNQGSIDAPSFTIMEWKPAKACNKTPIVLVGKGVVFDSGGMNIKTDDYMNDMKSDMAGAAVVANVICALAKSKIPLHLVALLPATDNRLNGNALVPGDIIYMHDHTSVEIVNTDAEGRLLLADAVSYARKYKPQLIITIATLTGAASRAVGKQGIAAMQENADAQLPIITKAGMDTYERLCFFPMWKEYEEALESNIADIKNCGNSEAGMITAAKFIGYFTEYPFIHLDIAGTAFLSKRDGYRGSGATASGARLLYAYLQEYAKNNSNKNA